jgi:L-ribulokinase
LGRPLQLGGSAQTPALGSAIHAAVAAGAYADIHQAADRMGRLKAEVVQPIAANTAVYDLLYAEYKWLYQQFGQNGLMERLKRLRETAR